jgi:hypothetical protein
MTNLNKKITGIFKMKNLFTKNYWAMKGMVMFVLVVMGGSVKGQTTVFSDDFSTNTSATYSTTGAISSSNWSVYRSGADWGARRNTSPSQLELTNDVSAATNILGWTFVSIPVSNFSSPYDPTLSSNPGNITWNFNMRSIRATSGFSSTTSYGFAVVLGGTSTSSATSGNGYAVTFGASGYISLISYTNGLQGTLNNIIAGSTSASTNYYSIRVIYTPSTNTWQLLSRNDGASSFSDPSTGSLTAVNTSAVNNTYTGTSLSNFGVYWQGSTSATQTTFFDNVKVTVVPASSNSTASDIITQSGYSYSSNIDYASKQTATTLTTANSIGVNGLTLRDGGATTDADALGTTLTDITFSTGGSTAIRSAALFDGVTNIAEVAVNGATSIAFTGLSISATDGSTKDFELRVTYQATVTDNQQITYTVSSATASAATSSFASSNAGAAASTATGDINRLEVSISSLVFSQQPSNVNTNVSMSPSVTVTAKDANNNIDLDFTDNVRVTSTGTMTGSPVSVAAVNGVATFSSLTHTALGSALTLLAERDNSSTWDLDVTSSTFNVAVVTSSTDYFRSLATGSWATAASWESSPDGSTNWITATLSPTSSANTITIRNGHTITISAVVSIDQVTVQSGGVLILGAGGAATIVNGTGDDIIIQNGGIIKYQLAPTYTSSTIRINGGGILSLEVAGLTANGLGVNATNHIYDDASILQYNLTSAPSTSGVTYFPNVTSEIPIFRFAQTLSGIGAGTQTTFNGRVELATGVSISWSGNSTKIFRNGIVGLGGIQTMTLSSGNGSWLISGSTAQLGTNGGTSLTLTNANGINISSTTTATLIGNLNIGASTTFTLKSDANGTANIGNSVGTITGNITVERYIPALRKFRFLASPVVGATAANWRNNGTNTAGIGTQITGNGGAANNFDASTTNAASAFWYNEVNAGSDVTVGSGATSDPGWTAFTDGNTEALTNGKGFRILVRGDRTISLDGSGSVTPTNTTLSVTGTYPANAVSIATTKTNSNTNSGYNLVGNPYPATIDWNLVTKGADISATYTIYDPTSNSYKSWNGTSGDASRYIASGQAFFVQQTGATGGITIDESDKVTNTAGNYFRNKLTDHLKVSMTYDSANYDAAFIHFRADALNEFDTYDGLKFQNAGVNIATVGSDGKRYNINSLASLTETTEMPLSVLGSVLTNFELKFEDVESFKNHELYLIDNYLNKMLLLSNGFTYPITLSSDSASVKDGRFKIVFVQKATGINSNEKISNAFILYPNPAANTIHLLLDAKNTNNENVSFEIFNQLGARLQQGSLDFTTAKDQTITIDNLAQGSYFIKLQSNSNQQTIKFIK